MIRRRQSQSSILVRKQSHDEGENSSFVDFTRKLPHIFPPIIRQLFGKIVENSLFQNLIIALIGVNAILMGVATYDIVEENPSVRHAFEIADQVFLIFFTAELGFQFIYRDFRIFLDGWLVFDVVVISLSWALSSAKAFRAFIKIVRAFRLVGGLGSLRDLITALWRATPNVVSIFALLLIIFYIFGVMFTDLFMFTYANGVTNEPYFGTLGQTFFTLFQIMTMDNWSEIAREVMATYTWAWMQFVSFVIISGFFVVNLIIGVICDAFYNLHITSGKVDDSQPVLSLQHEVDELAKQVEQLVKGQQQLQHSLDKTLRLYSSDLFNVIVTQQNSEGNIEIEKSEDHRGMPQRYSTKSVR